MFLFCKITSINNEYLKFDLSKKYTKEQIIEFYVNIPYLGSGAYGVEQAAQIYFNKSINELSLSEAALIAGLFQAPGAYDPYKFPEKAEARRKLLATKHNVSTDCILERVCIWKCMLYYNTRWWFCEMAHRGGEYVKGQCIWFL